MISLDTCQIKDFETINILGKVKVFCLKNIRLEKNFFSGAFKSQCVKFQVAKCRRPVAFSRRTAA